MEEPRCSSNVNVRYGIGHKELSMESLIIRKISPEDKDWVLLVLQKEWGSRVVITRKREHDASLLPGFIAELGQQRIGLITYRIETDECEIISLNSFMENMGVGSALIDAVTQEAKSLHKKRLWLITTNDNTPAIRFYQKRGFAFSALYPGAIEESRKLKPQIPFYGIDSIPIRDELEFELLLQNG